MWIQNVSRKDIAIGYHYDAGPNSMLIQIADPPGEFPTPKYTFKEVHRFEFLDVEEDTEVLDEEVRCSQEQANELVRLLQHAMQNDMNVIVHCHAGICRSGAVAEVGVIMGFQDTDSFRVPNLLVKQRMMYALGLVYDREQDKSRDLWYRY